MALLLRYGNAHKQRMEAVYAKEFVFQGMEAHVCVKNSVSTGWISFGSLQRH